MNKLDREELSAYRELAELMGGILAKRWMESRRSTGTEVSQDNSTKNTKGKKNASPNAQFRLTEHARPKAVTPAVQ